jgi:peroxiredoxin
MNGEASDNEGVTSVEYTLDDGRNWLPVDTLTSPGSQAVTFSFTPLVKADGNYPVRVRVQDIAGNSSVSPVYTFVIDRLVPHSGPLVHSIGPQILLPEPSGALVTLAGLEQRLTLAAVGGPTTVDLTAGPHHYSLTKNAETGLWSGTINLTDAGTYQLEVNLIDGAQNTTHEKLTTLIALAPGQVEAGDMPIAGAKVIVYVYDPHTQDFVLWQAQPFGQMNPQVTTDSGHYRLLLPAGKYYLEIDAKGYQTIRSHIFMLEHNTPLTARFDLASTPKITLGSWQIPWPGIIPATIPLELQYPELQASSSSLIGQSLPFFEFAPGSTGEPLYSTAFRGQPTILTFLTTWSPTSAEQLPVLEGIHARGDIKVHGILMQESPAAASLFQKRGQYTLPLLADPDGEFARSLQVFTSPTHIILNRQGHIKHVVSGVIPAEKLQSLVNE